MKFNLLKTMLVTVGIVIGVSGAWADAGDVVVNADIDCKGEIVDGVLEGTVNTMAIGTGGAETTIVNSSYMKLGDHENVVTIPENQYAGKRDIVEISFDMAWGNKNGMGNGIALKDADNVTIAHFDYARWGGGTNDMGIDFTDLLGGLSGYTAVWNNKTHFVITVDYAKGVISTEVTCGSNAKTFAVTIKNTNPIASFMVKGYNAGANPDRAGLFGNLVIKTIEGDYNIATAKYTVKWVDGETVIKEDTTRVGDVNDNITLFPSDLNNFFFDEVVKDVKYIVTGNDVEGKTISADGSTVVTILVRKAEKWAYTVTSSYNGNVLDWTTSGEVWEDDNSIAAHYPRYQQYENTLVGRKPNGNDLTTTIVVEKDGYTQDLAYTSENINNLYLLSEAEDLGTELSESGTSFDARVSGGKIIYGAEGKLFSLPAGKYIFTLGAIGGDNSNHIVNYNVYAGEQHIIKNGICNANKLTLIESSEFTLLEETDITFTSSDASIDRGIDLVYVQKTGEATVAASVGESGFATFCPTVGVSFAGVENVEAYKATTVAEGVVNLTKVETVAAGEGVLLRSVEGGAATADVTVDAAAVKAEDNIFIGVTEPIGALASEVDGKTNYILNDGKFYKANDQEVAAGKAYLAVEGTSEAKSLKIAFGGDTTGISEVNSTKADGAYYSVSGVRVANPTKGLYIMNGKKVIVK